VLNESKAAMLGDRPDTGSAVAVTSTENDTYDRLPALLQTFSTLGVVRRQRSLLGG
jgi:hypothetical protein